MPPCAATVWLRVGNSLVMHLQQGGDGGQMGASWRMTPGFLASH